MLPRVPVFALTLALVSAPLELRAAPEQDPIEDARELHARAQAKFETYEYEGAIELWTAAYEALGTSANADTIRNAIVYNLASARIKQFEIDGDRDHLKKAKLLLERYLQDYEALHGADAAAAERTNIEDKLGEIDEKLDSGAGADEPPPADPASGQKPAKKPRKKRKPGTYLISFGFGAVGLGVGALSLGMSAVAKGNRLQREGSDITTPAEDIPKLEREGRRANVRAIAFSVAGGALLGTGIGLITAGYRKRARAGKAAVLLSPTFAGVSWQTAF